MSLSHEDLLLLILSDQRWHSLHEILRHHPMMVHSRAAGLREKGYVIEHRCVGKGAKGSEYRLTGGPLTEGARRDSRRGSTECEETASPISIAPSVNGRPLSGLAETRAGAGGRPCSPAESFLPMGRTPQTASPLSGRQMGALTEEGLHGEGERPDSYPKTPLPSSVSALSEADADSPVTTGATLDTISPQAASLSALTEGAQSGMASGHERSRTRGGVAPAPAVSAPERPLVEPGETRDQEPMTAGSPGVSRTADAGAGQEGPLSPGSTSGPPWRDAGGCDSWGASLAPLAAAPDTVRLQESLPVPGQLSLEDAA